MMGDSETNWGREKSSYGIAGASVKTKPLDFSANSLVALLKRHAHSLEQSAFDIFPSNK